MSSTARPPVAAVRAAHGSRLVVASGQVATRDGELIAEGLVGDTVDLPTAGECARQCALNVIEAVRAELGGLDAVTAVLRLTVYVASAPGLREQHLVADAATDVMLERFGARGKHARAAIGVAGLPLGSPVEVDAMFLVSDAPGRRA
ncbi:RidA family protein [Actinomadura rubrisoli]|uniref:RidA family protein n=1 Tax=Actinomadura rubrisoli TaxID=2530368 RepID=A0A4R5CCA9_9ACTN|nr:RidA family protein [Actinomadura rubrisoli]TDD96426.1 RidA family protein [Actinomadura rubrisoli]